MKQTCPRRMNEMGPWEYKEGKDSWRRGTSFSEFQKDKRFKSCSFCGSLEPAIFLEKLREGWVLTPTDKNYKAYLAEPIEPYKIGTGEGVHEVEITVDHKDVGKFYFQHFSETQRKDFVALVNEKAIRFGYPGYLYSRPYFMVPA